MGRLLELAKTLKAANESLSKDKDGSAPFSSDIERQLIERMAKETREAITALGSSPDQVILSLEQHEDPEPIAVKKPALDQCVVTSLLGYAGGYSLCVDSRNVCVSNTVCQSSFDPAKEYLAKLIFESEDRKKG